MSCAPTFRRHLRDCAGDFRERKEYSGVRRCVQLCAGRVAQLGGLPVCSAVRNTALRHFVSHALHRHANADAVPHHVADLFKVSRQAFGVAQQVLHFPDGVILRRRFRNVDVQPPEARSAAVVEPLFYLGIRVHGTCLFPDGLDRTGVPLNLNRRSDDSPLRFHVGGGVVPLDFEVNGHLIQHALVAGVHFGERHAGVEIFKHPVLQFSVDSGQDLRPRLFCNNPRQAVRDPCVPQVNHPRYLRR